MSKHYTNGKFHVRKYCILDGDSIMTVGRIYDFKLTTNNDCIIHGNPVNIITDIDEMLQYGDVTLEMRN